VKPPPAVADKVPAPAAKEQPPPYLLTVKLLGLEAEDRGDLRESRCTVEVIHPVDEEGEGHHDNDHQKGSRLMAGLEAAVSMVKTKVKAATGLGFGVREAGVPKKRKSGKAVLWSATKVLEDSNKRPVPPMAIRAMEKLHIREQWGIDKVANMFALDPETVRTAVAMRGNFEVVWHEALHFLQPATDPYLGKVRVTVQAPASHQVRGADDHGLIGEFDIDLNENAMPADSDVPWKRRIRKMIYRQKDKSSAKAEREEALHHNLFKKDITLTTQGTKGEQGKGDHGEGMQSTGILIELVVEVRQLEKAPVELDQGQTLRSRAELIEATLSPGVRMIPE